MLEQPLSGRQLHLQPLTDGARSALQGHERDREIGRIEEPLHRGSTRVHAAGELRLRDVALLHLLRDLVGDDPLGCDSICLLEDSLVVSSGTS